MRRSTSPPIPEPSDLSADAGVRLATLQRGEGVELRVSLAESRDCQSLALKVWHRSHDGVWCPAGPGCSIPINEDGDPVALLIEAFGRLEDLEEGIASRGPRGR